MEEAISHPTAAYVDNDLKYIYIVLYVYRRLLIINQVAACWFASSYKSELTDWKQQQQLRSNFEHLFEYLNIISRITEGATAWLPLSDDSTFLQSR